MDPFPSKKFRFTNDAAWSAAMEILQLLGPVCEKFEVAGSLRRRRPQVSDIEIVFVSSYKSAQQPEDFFGDPPLENQVEPQIEALLEMQVLRRRLNSKGRTSWGVMNKLAVHVRTGIPVDLFTSSIENFYNYLVCRTGPAESNIDICNAAIAKGWKWNPYGSGFTRNDGNASHPVSTEREVFEFVGLPYKEPWDR